MSTPSVALPDQGNKAPGGVASAASHGTRGPGGVRPLLWLRVALLCCWLLLLTTFSFKGREGGDAGPLDLIALTKAAVRLGSIAALGLALLFLWPSPRRRLVLSALLPFGLFLGWAFLSVSWSALKSFSFGQALGLLVFLQLTAVIGITATRPEHQSLVLFHLSLILLVVSGIVLGVDLVRHDLSGLDRDDVIDGEGWSGLVHPTSAGSTASLGLTLLLSANVLWGWKWARILLVPGLLLHSVLLVLAASRMAMGMAAGVIFLLLCFYLKRRLLAAGVVALSLVGTLLLVVDPGLELMEQAKRRAVSKITREESAESLTSLTGRTALWDAIWIQVWASPLIGHGYFVTSPTGLLDVWWGPANHTAHNAFLQVLVSTGGIGLLLFLWGLGHLLWVIGRALRHDGPAAFPAQAVSGKKRGECLSPLSPVLGGEGSGVRGLGTAADPLTPDPSPPSTGERGAEGSGPDAGSRPGGDPLPALLILLGLWYLGWAQLCESFMGPVQPEALVFYVLLGLGLGQVRPSGFPKAGPESSTSARNELW